MTFSINCYNSYQIHITIFQEAVGLKSSLVYISSLLDSEESRLEQRRNYEVGEENKTEEKGKGK